MVDAGECDAEVFERCGFRERFLPKRIIGNDGKVSIRKAIAQFILVFRQAVIGGDGEAVFWRSAVNVSSRALLMASGCAMTMCFMRRTPFIEE